MGIICSPCPWHIGQNFEVFIYSNTFRKKPFIAVNLMKPRNEAQRWLWGLWRKYLKHSIKFQSRTADWADLLGAGMDRPESLFLSSASVTPWTVEFTCSRELACRKRFLLMSPTLVSNSKKSKRKIHFTLWFSYPWTVSEGRCTIFGGFSHLMMSPSSELVLGPALPFAGMLNTRIGFFVVILFVVVLLPCQ